MARVKNLRHTIFIFMIIGLGCIALIACGSTSYLKKKIAPTDKA